jgi:predicted nucleic acid-binding protein
MDILNTRPTWLTSLLPLLAYWQYGDRELVRGELYRMALSADAAARSAEALRRIADVLDRERQPIDAQRAELRAIVRAALSELNRVPASAPVAMLVEHRGSMH